MRTYTGLAFAPSSLPARRPTTRIAKPDPHVAKEFPRRRFANPGRGSLTGCEQSRYGQTTCRICDDLRVAGGNGRSEYCVRRSGFLPSYKENIKVAVALRQLESHSPSTHLEPTSPDPRSEARKD